MERGLIGPMEHRLTPEQPKQEAKDLSSSLAKQRGQRPVKLREQVAETKRRHAKINDNVGQRSPIIQELGEALNKVHEDAGTKSS